MLALDMLRGAAGAQPTLDLNFTSGTLDSRVTYTGASLATLTDATGAIAYKPHNLFLQSEAVHDAAWSKTSCTASAGVIIPSVSSAQHYIHQSVCVSGTTYKLHFDVRASGYQWLKLVSSASYLNIDAINGVIGLSSGMSATISSNGDGSFRVIATFVALETRCIFNVAQSNNASWDSVVFAGDGTSGIGVTRVGLNVGPLQPYYPTTGSAYYGPRFTYDPVTLSALGLLIEEQRTQLLLNSLIDGTNLSTQSVTTTATAYTLSFYGTGTVTLSGTSTGAKVGTGAYPTRSTFTFTPTAGTLTLTVTGTVQYAQLEEGSFATSFIPTAGASVTRAADSATMTGSNFSSWFNAAQGTFVADATYVPGASGAAAMVVFSANNSSANGYMTYKGSLSGSITPIYDAGTLANVLAALPGGNRVKYAMTYSATSDTACANGGAISSAATISVATPIQMQIGRAVAGYLFTGTIARLRYYNTALTSAQLQALTT